MPEISIIVPAYNRADQLPEAIKSILDQTFQDWQAIIVDDGSTDNTREVIERYAREYPGKFKYVYQKNKGPAAARNMGINQAEGKCIAFLDSDDLWLPKMLERSHQFLSERHFDWVNVASYRLLNERGDRELREMGPPYLDGSGEGIQLLKNGLFFFSSVPVFIGSVLLRKNCLEKAGLFNESFKIGEDWDLWLRFEEHGLRGGYLNEPLFIYRILYQDSVMRSPKGGGLKAHINIAAIHARLLGNAPVIKRSHSDFLWRCADIYLAGGRYLSAIKCMAKSWLIYPEKEKLTKMKNFIKRRMGIKP